MKASFFFSLKDQWYDPGVVLLPSLPGGGEECGEGAGCMKGGGPGFRCVLLSLNQNKIKYLTP